MKKHLLILALTLVAITGNAQSSPRGDMDNDGVVSVSDVMELVGIILNGDAPQSYLTCPDNHHPHLIDLGLPSGTKWACCNVGADTPEAYGGYYAWGETEEKSTYSWSNYIHCDGSKETCHDIGSDIAGTQYDVAHVKWGGSWMMPSVEQQDELRSNCTYEWTTVNGVNGGKFTSKTNGASIFLPAAGHRITILRNANETGHCWSSTQNPSNSDIAFYLQFYSDNAAGQSQYRYVGRSVRPIYVGDTYKAFEVSKSNVETFAGKSTTVEITSGSGYYKVSSSAPNVAEASLSGSTITIKGVSAGLAVMVVTDTKSGSSQYIIATVKQYLSCPDNHHPHVIDLGLPSGTKWACCNVGADTPEAYGGYYAWGETEEKSTYSWSNYIHCDGTEQTCHNIGSDIAGTQYDVAHVKWGGSWVMPSKEQQDELISNCTYEWTTVNDVKGGKFTSNINGGSIFLPAAGDRNDSGLHGAGAYGNNWSSTQSPSYSDCAYYLFSTVYGGWLYSSRYYGQSVRPIYVGDTYKPLALSKSNVEMSAVRSATVEITSGSGYYKVSSSAPNVAEASLSGSTITIKGVSAGLAVIVVTDTKSGSSQYIIATVKQAYLTCPDDHHPHVIDLGLPSGTLWSCCNVGADTPEGYGGYYAWGETKEKSTYSWSTYIHCDGSEETCHDLGSDIAGTEYDVAHVKWGGSWVMPSRAQLVELRNNCTLKWTTVNGVNGGKFTSKTNGGSIFLPAAGYRSPSGLYDAGSSGNYWSSTQYPSHTGYAYCLRFINSSGPSGLDTNNGYSLFNGRSVRPVVGN